MTIRSCALAALVVLGGASANAADFAVSSNDAHSVMQNGTPVGVQASDTLSIIEFGSFPPRITKTIKVPGSVVGPPTAVALADNNTLAIVSAATKVDPADTKKLVPDDRVSVIDLTANPPKILQQVQAGAGAATVAVSPDNSLVLVANRTEGTVSIFGLANKALTSLGKLDLGNPKAGPSGLVFLPDGKHALLSRDGDSMVSVLAIDGQKVTIEPRAVTTGMRPYTMSLSSARNLVAVSNMGRGDGDIDTVSLIDVSKVPFRTVDTLAVGGSPEGLKFSPDGRFLAVGLQDGSTKAENSPFRTKNGRLVMLDVGDKALRKLAEAPVGAWSQGIAFSRDGSIVLVQNMVERNISVFRWKSPTLEKGGSIDIGAGPAAIATPW